MENFKFNYQNKNRSLDQLQNYLSGKWVMVTYDMVDRNDNLLFEKNQVIKISFCDCRYLNVETIRLTLTLDLPATNLYNFYYSGGRQQEFIREIETSLLPIEDFTEQVYNTPIDQLKSTQLGFEKMQQAGEKLDRDQHNTIIKMLSFIEGSTTQMLQDQ